MIRLFILLSLVIGIAYGAGVRVHFDEIPRYFTKDTPDQYQKVFLTEGEFIVGRVLEDNEDSIKIRMGKGTADFSKDRIEKIEEVTAEEIKSGIYAYWVDQNRPGALVTRDFEDSIVPYFQEEVMPGAVDVLADVASRVGEKVASKMQPSAKDVSSFTASLSEADRQELGLSDHNI